MAPKPDLSEEAARLFEEHNGRWSETEPKIFFFDCPHDKAAAICRFKQTKETDAWLASCPTVGCTLHGEQEISVIDVDDDEMKRRKSNPKQYDESGGIVTGFESLLTLAANLSQPNVDYAAILDRTMDMIRRYVFLGRDEAVISALWVAHTWCLPAARYTPYIHLRSALPREGKTILMELMEYIVARPLVISDPTPAALSGDVTAYMIGSGEPPTMLWDEIDTVFERRSELREYVNLGFKRSAQAVIRRATGDRYVFGPKMIAGLTDLRRGRLSTIRDRSLRFDMVEPLPEEIREIIEDNREDIEIEANEIKLALNVMAEDHIPYLRSVKPDMPEELDPRARDIARPLFAIADLIGGDWPIKAREAVVNIRKRMIDSEFADEKLVLLRDIRRVFGINKQMPSQTIVDRLANLPDGRWQGLTPRKLAMLLHEFSEYPGGPRIKPKQMRVKGIKGRFYERRQFRDPWKRYMRRIKDE